MADAHDSLSGRHRLPDSPKSSYECSPIPRRPKRNRDVGRRGTHHAGAPAPTDRWRGPGAQAPAVAADFEQAVPVHAREIRPDVARLVGFTLAEERPGASVLQPPRARPDIQRAASRAGEADSRRPRFIQSGARQLRGLAESTGYHARRQLGRACVSGQPFTTTLFSGR